MNQLVLLGMQWGDEGKGKLVDLLTDFSDYVVRFQGGGNAGHTLLVENEKFVLHIVPSGILHDNVTSIIANGVVVDLKDLTLEIEYLKENNISVSPENLKISYNSHLIFPYHRLIDEYRENKRSNKIGTTKKGIGPTYEDQVARRGIRFQDFLNKDLFDRLLKDNLEYYNFLFKNLFKKPQLSLEEIIEEFDEYRENLKDYATDTSLLLDDAIRQKSNILFEGAQGTLLDIAHGTYPYVTSSNTTAGGAITGSGIGPSEDLVSLGIFKAYTTRVGEGPFPTELSGELEEKLRSVGREYGATTGRNRRVGWLDIVALKYAIRINRIKTLAITKLDILSDFDEIKVCVAYVYDGEKITNYINRRELLENVECEYETYPGWNEPIDEVRDFEDLPTNAIKYIKSLEIMLEVPIDIVSVGAERSATILKVNPFRR